MQLAPFIDHTVLKQTTTQNDIDKLCEEAVAYGFAAVCIPPFYVQRATGRVKDSSVKVATVIGFPLGYTYTAAKVKEAEQAITDGAHELDMVMNLGALKNGDYRYLENEIASLLAVTQKNAAVKVIIESGILTEKEIIQCCEIYKNFDVLFLKTSTGYAEKGATVEAVQLMRRHLPSSIQIKASGGIRTYAFACQLIEAGATRLGTSSGVALVANEPAGETNY